MNNYRSVDQRVINSFMLQAAKLVHEAALAGVILTIERRPLKPFATGYTEAMIEARPARLLSPETHQAMWDAVKGERAIPAPPEASRVTW